MNNNLEYGEPDVLTKEQKQLQKMFRDAINNFQSSNKISKSEIQEKFNKTIVIAVQHILNSTPPLFEFLKECGLPKDQLFLTGKCYSTIESAYNKIAVMFNSNNIIKGEAPQSGQDYNYVMQKSCNDILEKAKDFISNHDEKIDTIIIVDEGGKLSRPENFSDEIRKKKFLIIEHTTQGNYFPHQQYLNSAFINFARSALKFYLEPRIIQHGVRKNIRINEIVKLISEYRDGFRMGLIGLGAIGQEILYLLITLKKMVLCLN